jgi:rhodanese-related sulfurtransferase
VLDVALRAVALVALGSALGAGLGFARHGGVAAPAQAREQTCGAGEASAAVPHVHAQDAAALCAAGRAAVLDVRPAARFAAGHVAEALHLPCDAAAVEGAIASALAAADFIIVYGDTTAEAEPVAQALVARYGPRVQILDGGYARWEAEGWACASGPCPGCAEGGP